MVFPVLVNCPPFSFQLFKLSSPSYGYLHTIPKRSIPLFFLVNKKRPTKTIYTIPRIPFPIKTTYSNFLRDLPIPMLLPVRWQCPNAACSFPKAQSSAFSLPVTVFRLYCDLRGRRLLKGLPNIMEWYTVSGFIIIYANQNIDREKMILFWEGRRWCSRRM